MLIVYGGRPILSILFLSFSVFQDVSLEPLSKPWGTCTFFLRMAAVFCSGLPFGLFGAQKKSASSRRRILRCIFNSNFAHRRRLQSSMNSIFIDNLSLTLQVEFILFDSMFTYMIPLSFHPFLSGRPERNGWSPKKEPPAMLLCLTPIRSGGAFETRFAQTVKGLFRLRSSPLPTAGKTQWPSKLTRFLPKHSKESNKSPCDFYFLMKPQSVSMISPLFKVQSLSI